MKIYTIYIIPYTSKKTNYTCNMFQMKRFLICKERFERCSIKFIPTRKSVTETTYRCQHLSLQLMSLSACIKKNYREDAKLHFGWEHIIIDKKVRLPGQHDDGQFGIWTDIWSLLTRGHSKELFQTAISNTEADAGCRIQKSH